MDITEKKKAERRQKRADARIWRQAKFDSLTGLPNRSLFHDRLENDIRSLRKHSESLALFFIDIDNFKMVNDSLGHNRGDLLLIEAARRIISCVRSSDTVARLGGDEFTIIVPSVPDHRRIDLIVRAIQRAFARPFVLDGSSVNTSASIGIALYPSDASDPEHLVINADQAMYQAKALGSGHYCYFADMAVERAGRAGSSHTFPPPGIPLNPGIMARKAKVRSTWRKPDSA